METIKLLILALLISSICIYPIAIANSSISSITYTIKNLDNAKELTLNLSSNYNLTSIAKSENINESDLLNKSVTNYFGEIEIKLYEKTFVTEYNLISHECDCKKINLKNGTTENNCSICYENQSITKEVLTELNNLSNYILNKDAILVEVPIIKRFAKMPNGGMGYSAYSSVNILGNNIPNMTWWNTTYFNRYNLTLSNNGSLRTNELVFINISGINTFNANKTDLRLFYNDSTEIPYQFMNNKTEIVFRANLTNGTTYGYNIYTNSSNDTYYHNLTFIDVFSNGEFEIGEGYIIGSSVNGINGFVTNTDCNGGAQTAIDRINSTGAYRGNSGLVIPNGRFFKMPNYTQSGNITTYLTMYISKTTGNANEVTYYSYSGGRKISTIYFGQYGGSASDNGLSYQNSTNDTITAWFNNTYATFLSVNAKLVTNGNSNFSYTNSTGSVFELITPPKTSLTTIYPHCISNFGSGGLSIYDNLFISTSEINQYLNYTTATYIFESLESPPLVQFISQSPSNITIFSMFYERLNISYSIIDNDVTPVNNSTAQIYYKTNDTIRDGTIYVNGTLTLGYANTSYDNSSGTIYNFSLGDSKVYPATYNIEQIYMQQTPKLNRTISGTNTYGFQQMINITNKTYNFIEIYALPPASGSVLQIWLCNSTQQQNMPASANCFQVCGITNTQPYNHTHTQYSKHYVCPFLINGTSNLTNGVKINNSMYIYFRSSNTQSWQIEYITNTSRTNSLMFTANNGNTYTQLNGTIDAHIHQFGNNETLYYYACANDTINTQGCSSVNNLSIDLVTLPPTPPNVWSPNSSQIFYKNQSVPINYTNATSNDNGTLTHYNISLLSSGLSFLQTIIANNDLNLSYAWNASTIASGFYVIRVEICTTNNLCSSGFSELFRLQSPFVLNPNKREIVYAIKEIVTI